MSGYTPPSEHEPGDTPPPEYSDVGHSGYHVVVTGDDDDAAFAWSHSPSLNSRPVTPHQIDFVNLPAEPKLKQSDFRESRRGSTSSLDGGPVAHYTGVRARLESGNRSRAASLTVPPRTHRRTSSVGSNSGLGPECGTSRRNYAILASLSDIMTTWSHFIASAPVLEVTTDPESFTKVAKEALEHCESMPEQSVLNEVDRAGQEGATRDLEFTLLYTAKLKSALSRAQGRLVEMRPNHRPEDLNLAQHFYSIWKIEGQMKRLEGLVIGLGTSVDFDDIHDDSNESMGSYAGSDASRRNSSVTWSTPADLPSHR